MMLFAAAYKGVFCGVGGCPDGGIRVRVEQR